MSRLDELKRRRPRSRFLRASVVVLAALTAYAWLSGAVDPGGLFTERRLDNLNRFLTKDIVPYPMRDTEFELGALLPWARGVLAERGSEAALAALAISVLAITLAGLISLVFAPLAASNVATQRPFESNRNAESTRANDRLRWRALRIVTRGVMILLRAIPEYVLAFLLLAILGPGHAWPAVLALALHNGGILGRLGAETIENLDPGPLRSMRAIGASRRAVLVTGVFPLALGRYLLYFFYRFETCVREATVLGMLGVVSLGYWIQDARAKQYYDEMLLLVAVGAAIVLAADAVSALARRYVRGGA
jgi:phosphonate transport system permease protein